VASIWPCSGLVVVVVEGPDAPAEGWVEVDGVDVDGVDGDVVEELVSLVGVDGLVLLDELELAAGAAHADWTTRFVRPIGASVAPVAPTTPTSATRVARPRAGNLIRPARNERSGAGRRAIRCPRNRR
jgi:hypothetical protein